MVPFCSLSIEQQRRISDGEGDVSLESNMAAAAVDQSGEWPRGRRPVRSARQEKTDAISLERFHLMERASGHEGSMER